MCRNGRTSRTAFAETGTLSSAHLEGILDKKEEEKNKMLSWLLYNDIRIRRMIAGNGGPSAFYDRSIDLDVSIIIIIQYRNQNIGCFVRRLCVACMCDPFPMMMTRRLYLRHASDIFPSIRLIRSLTFSGQRIDHRQA